MADDRNAGGGPHHHRPRPPLDGAFLLHLLQNPNPNPSHSQHHHQQSQPPKPMPRTKPPSSSPSLGLGFFPHGEGPRGDPAVAAMGPSHPFLPHSFLPPPPNLNLHQHPLHLSPPPPGFHPRPPPGFAEGGFLNSRTGGYRNAEAEQKMARSAPAERRHLGEVGGFMTSNGQSSLRRGNEGRAGTSGISREEVVRGRGFEVIERGDALAERLEDALVLGDDAVDGNLVKSTSSSSRGKDVRLDLFRGHHVSSQRVRIRRRELECRYEIESFTPYFMSIYKSLVPADEEKAKQKQLLLSLRNLVNKEWPNAQLHLYGSCANSFGFPNSDIDICLSVDDTNTSKPDILLKLADLLQSGNLENVQALTHARVPIVKMMDPVTGIACDICINNLLAVVNTKLLRDYAQIDDRLRQLAFVVKHWAKSRGVNETYRGTLSSYAYVLMCIHFLQLRKPAILPCLQEMQATYVVTIDDTQCAYFDQVDRLRNFGVQNNESIARLLWGFFQYWAYSHDYANDVVSVRTGRLISKRAKDWTRRIGNDRHLICIEDPFEISHDLGRVVDKYSIKILREEFERAAEILQYDPNPSVTLFEPYMPRPVQDDFQSDSFR